VFNYGTSGWVSRDLTHASLMAIVMAYGSVTLGRYLKNHVNRE